MNILENHLGVRQCPFKLIETSRNSEAKKMMIDGPTQLGQLWQPVVQRYISKQLMLWHVVLAISEDKAGTHKLQWRVSGRAAVNGIFANSSTIFCADAFSEKRSTAAVQVLPGARRTLANNPHPLHNDGNIRPEGTSRLSVKEMAEFMQVNHQLEHQSRLFSRGFTFLQSVEHF